MSQGIYTSTTRTLTNGEGAAPALDVNARTIVVNPDGSNVGGGVEYNATPPTLADTGTDAVQSDMNGNTKVTLATILKSTIDSITSRPEGTTYTNITASTLIRTGTGILVGMYVNSTSSGTIKFWDNTSAATTVINNTITPAIGYHPLGNAAFSTGLYATIANTLDVTIYYIPTP